MFRLLIGKKGPPHFTAGSISSTVAPHASQEAIEFVLASIRLQGRFMSFKEALSHVWLNKTSVYTEDHSCSLFAKRLMIVCVSFSAHFISLCSISTVSPRLGAALFKPKIPKKTLGNTLL